MDVSNDPRFYTDNVLNYRLAAFGSLAVVSGLMVQNAMDHVFDMNKEMRWEDTPGFMQWCSFSLLCLVLALNYLATYVGVAQPYHTIRLMTAGPTGFEAAASYYLNPNIVQLRHLGIKAMLWSLPLFAISQGPRVYTKFWRGNMAEPELPDKTPFWSSKEGQIFGATFLVYSLFLFWVHWVHFKIFRDRYKHMYRQVTPEGFSKYKRDLLRKSGGGDVDV